MEGSSESVQVFNYAFEALLLKTQTHVDSILSPSFYCAEDYIIHLRRRRREIICHDQTLNIWNIGP